MRKVKSLWDWVIEWFEWGDLVPLLVVISAVHYAAVLRNKDTAVVAIAIGLLVDLGHFRTIRAAFRYNGNDNWHKFARWGIAAVMTAISLAYHERFYADIWLSAPIPFLIASLAWLQKVDQRNGSKPKSQTSEPPAIAVNWSATDLAKTPDATAIQFADTCEKCNFIARGDTSRQAQNKLNAHMRVHANGKAA